MNLGDVVLWGFLATVVLSVVMAGSVWLGLSRMSLPYLLGTMVSAHRDRALLLGTGLHLLAGWLFAILYVAAFESLERATVWLGALFGLTHALFVLLMVMPILPSLHPRMASETSDLEPTCGLEPPGFLALNYGHATAWISIVAHVLYGVILGLGYRLT